MFIWKKFASCMGFESEAWREAGYGGEIVFVRNADWEFG